ncbi:hypothetical protein CH330_05505 [candidate division WOR-3 bacterium JGI_Cruoil_03_51_56]|uniref:Uncharacterized protein n=1 Tax=candidate division WOR-3 bacterium JGI_Cruoil_03_51_56 TaxID=1973747 RepID=A0A235BT75_UNCW3|nr:MAG: hypothetical protein CH330_05505 [candidate division WOR-3 bacterium JGI_Cruoil_03_51_56]
MFLKLCFQKSLLVQLLDSNVQLFRIVFLNPSRKSSRVLFPNPFPQQSPTPNPMLFDAFTHLASR